MTLPLRCALVGAGRIAQTYAQALADCPELDPVAVVDHHMEAAIALAGRLGCPAFATVEECLDFEGVEAAILCTPPNTHRPLAARILQQGRHVLCEKPFCPDVAGARAMIAAARDNGVLLTMASKFRYVNDVIKARALVRSGLLGEIVLVENVFASRVEMGQRWNADPAVSGGGVLIDNGTHSVDLMRYFLGPLAQVQAVEGKRVQGLAVEDTVRVLVRSAGGVLGSIDLSWSINKEQDAYLTIHGSAGTLVVGWKESRYRLHGDPEWFVFGKGYDKVQAFRGQLVNFARAARGEEQLLITAKDALASVAVVRAAYRSMGRSHWTRVARRKITRQPA
jgi:predicted dehydrogenase